MHVGANLAPKENKSKGAKIRNRYNQVPHLTLDTNGKVTNSQSDTTNESQEVNSSVKSVIFFFFKFNGCYGKKNGQQIRKSPFWSKLKPFLDHIFKNYFETTFLRIILQQS